MTLVTAQHILYLPSMDFQHRQGLPSVPALYFVMDDQLNFMYIGQTANLHGRWKSHHRAPQMRPNVHRIYWVEIADDVRRADAERRAIVQFDPAWNRSEIASDGRWVREAIAYIARRRGITQSDLLFRVAREWLASSAGLDLK